MERSAALGLPPSLAEYEEIQALAKRCRGKMPALGRICRGAGEETWAGCVLREAGKCKTVAEEAIEHCRRLSIVGVREELLEGHRRDLIDLGR